VWLVCWSLGYLVERLVWSVERSDGCLVAIDRLIGWLVVGWLVGGISVGWVVGLAVGRSGGN